MIDFFNFTKAYISEIQFLQVKVIIFYINNNFDTSKKYFH